MDPSTTRTKGSNSPRSALKNHSRKSSAPPLGPHSKSIRGQCTATWGSPGRAPKAISSTLGWVAAVNATESPSQLRPALIHRTWINVCSALTAASVGMMQLSGAGLGLLRHRSRPSAHLRDAIFWVYSRYRALSTFRRHSLVGLCRIATETHVSLADSLSQNRLKRGGPPANVSQE